MKTPFNDTNSMKALVYGSPGLKTWEVKPKPVIKETTDAIVRATMTTVCGTDLHILKWDVSTVTNSRILDHEGIGKVGEQENRCH
jgi:alcohol dehydrogenase